MLSILGKNISLKNIFIKTKQEINGTGRNFLSVPMGGEFLSLTIEPFTSYSIYHFFTYMDPYSEYGSGFRSHKVPENGSSLDLDPQYSNTVLQLHADALRLIPIRRACRSKFVLTGFILGGRHSKKSLLFHVKIFLWTMSSVLNFLSWDFAAKMKNVA